MFRWLSWFTKTNTKSRTKTLTKTTGPFPSLDTLPNEILDSIFRVLFEELTRPRILAPLHGPPNLSTFAASRCIYLAAIRAYLHTVELEIDLNTTPTPKLYRKLRKLDILPMVRRQQLEDAELHGPFNATFDDRGTFQLRKVFFTNVKTVTINIYCSWAGAFTRAQSKAVVTEIIGLICQCDTSLYRIIIDLNRISEYVDLCGDIGEVLLQEIKQAVKPPNLLSRDTLLGSRRRKRSTRLIKAGAIALKFSKRYIMINLQ